MDTSVIGRGGRGMSTPRLILAALAVTVALLALSAREDSARHDRETERPPIADPFCPDGPILGDDC